MWPCRVCRMSLSCRGHGSQTPTTEGVHVQGGVGLVCMVMLLFMAFHANNNPLCFFVNSHKFLLLMLCYYHKHISLWLTYASLCVNYVTKWVEPIVVLGLNLCVIVEKQIFVCSLIYACTMFWWHVWKKYCMWVIILYFVFSFLIMRLVVVNWLHVSFLVIFY